MMETSGPVNCNIALLQNTQQTLTSNYLALCGGST